LLKYIRLLLFPFALLYGVIIQLRNFFFDIGFLSSKNFNTPSLGVGNLSMGGTGKSVVVTYLIDLLQKTKTLATLSRGYGRKTKGLRIADINDTAATLGDEPFQFLNRYSNLRVIVSENRLLGMEALKLLNPVPEVVIMDDIMQHRWVKPSLLILTTDYKNPYFKDYILPIGGLREFKSGVNRADLILVTRSPSDLSMEKKVNFLKGMKSKIPVFFTTIKYAQFLYKKNQSKSDLELNKGNFILVTGIADSSQLVDYLKTTFGGFKHLKFSDHYHFSNNDIDRILNASEGKIIVTTEKDYGRLSPLISDEKLCYIKISLDFIFEKDQKQFDRIILDAI
jgi:tetraacyldisaccharide 4'-kinase